MTDQSSNADYLDLDRQVDCWACSTRLKVPVVNGKLAPEFKCGWCGAVSTELTCGLPSTLERSCDDSDGETCCCGSKANAFFQRLGQTRACVLFQRGLQWGTVVIVIGLITSVVGLGVWFVVPRLPAPWLHAAFAAILSLNIYFNYYLTVFQSPGSPQDIAGHRKVPARGPTVDGGGGDGGPTETADSEPCQQVTRGAFSNYTYCFHCKDMKPPQAHHCRVCGRCVIEMDHHCPFVNNCIGAANLRPFILFLFWATSACLYSLGCSIYVLLCYHSRFHSRRVSYQMSGLSLFSSWTMVFVDMLVEAVLSDSNQWVFAAVYVCVVSFGVTIGVGMLFIMQLSQVLSGVSYIDKLKGGSASSSTRMQNLQRVFGTGHPLTWFWPRVSTPAGAGAVSNPLKKGM